MNERRGMSNLTAFMCLMVLVGVVVTSVLVLVAWFGRSAGHGAFAVVTGAATVSATRWLFKQSP